MTREEIRNEIIYDLEEAWEHHDQVSYWLEKLPMQGDYDEKVHDFIHCLKYAIIHSDREYYDIVINDLVEQYYVNQENYNF